MNHLRHEKSPYLLQHADNPVDWYAWGEEAFAKARAEDKPVFLSIGYSTCHWCHVLAHESFEDKGIAQLMNEAFVNIKVDREERPDIDSLYMGVCQALTGSGGWPLTVVMTPDKRPFFAGTYFPKDSFPGRIGMRDLIARLSELWDSERARVEASAEDIIAWLKRETSLEEGAAPGIPALQAAYDELKSRFDEIHGGFGDAPKFPSPHTLSFLLRYHRRFQDKKALAMVTITLDAMRAGGIYDHLGFGFHRYATDRRWFLPHFEKMLYDQALLAFVYTEAYQVTGTAAFGVTAREILSYVLRDLRSPQGAFFSAEDADSEGREGAFYLWKADEIRAVLDGDAAQRWMQTYSLISQENVSDEKNAREGVLAQTRAASPAAPNHVSAGLEDLAPSRAALLAVRERRIRPGRDEKILCDWNGLMIAALAKAAQVFEDPALSGAARQAADFCLENLRAPDGTLKHRWHDGQAAIEGFLDDYAFLVWGLIELYEALFEVRYLEAALELTSFMIAHFRDETSGGLFFTAPGHEDLFVRKKELVDGALPSGNSVAALNLARLGRMTGNQAWEDHARRIGRAFSPQIERSPWAFTQYLSALDFLLGPTQAIIVVGKPARPDVTAMLRAAQAPFAPNKTLAFLPSDADTHPLKVLIPFSATMASIQDTATAYVCSDSTCREPITDPSSLLNIIR
ncbi:MAG: thioredoxin domain-containing protein [Syntrophaceae bacterium]